MFNWITIVSSFILLLIFQPKPVYTQNQNPNSANPKSLSLGFNLISQQTAYFNRQINLSNYDPEPTFGRAIGICVRYTPNNRYFFQLEGLNSFQGQKYSYSQPELDTAGNVTSIFLYSRSFELNYYKFPILAGVVLNPHEIVQIQIGLGPQLSFLNTAYYILDADTIIRKDRSFKQTLRKIDTGLALFAGIRTRIRSGLFFQASFRSDFSLLDAESIRFKPVSYASSKNFTGGISFGISWNFSWNNQPPKSQSKTTAMPLN
jgi:hypothetical protein